jgi:type II secretion system protein I
MLTLKAGILMLRHQRRPKADCVITHKGRIGAFTFVEVMVALSIVSISLMALLRLHVISVRMVENAQTISQAVFLADEKIAETLAISSPEEGIRSGTVEKNGLKLNWETRVESLQSTQWDGEDIAGLHKVLVDVSWKQGENPRHLRMLTYIADRELP